MINRDVKYIKGGEALDFDIAGFAVNPNGDTAIAFAADYITQVLTVVGTGNVIVYGSAQKSPPDFTVPSDIDNSYIEIALTDYSIPGTYYAGIAGITVTAETKIVELNTNLLSWVAIFRDLDTVDVKLTETDNS